MVGLSVRTTVWQFMQTASAGIIACRDRSALEWQYRQGILFVPAWILWLNGMGCMGA